MADERNGTSQNQAPENSTETNHEDDFLKALNGIGLDGGFTEEDENQIEAEEKQRAEHDEEAEFYEEPMGEYIPQDVMTAVKDEMQDNADKDFADKISQNPLETSLTEEGIAKQKREEARMAGEPMNTAETEVLYDDPVAGEYIPEDVINQLRGGQDASDPVLAEQPSPQEENAEEQPQEAPPRNIVDETEDTHQGTKFSGEREYKTMAQLLDELATLRLGAGDPMDAFAEALLQSVDKVVHHSLDNLETRLDFEGNRLDHRTHKFEKDGDDLGGTIENTEEASTSNAGVITNTSFWTLHLNKMAESANLIDSPILALSVAEQKTHAAKWKKEKTFNRTAAKETNPIEEHDGRLTKIKKAIFGSKYNPNYEKKLINFSKETDNAIKAVANGDSKGIKEFISDNDTIVDAVETQMRENLGMDHEKEHTLDDFKFAAENRFAREIERLEATGQSAEDAAGEYLQLKDQRDLAVKTSEVLFAAKRESLVSEMHMLKEDVVKNNDQLKHKAIIRDDLIKKAKFEIEENKGDKSRTGMDSIRDELRSTYENAVADSETEKEAMKKFIENTPKYKGKMKPEELFEAGKLCAETDFDVKTVLDLREQVHVSDEALNQLDRIQQATSELGEIDAQLQTDNSGEIRDTAVSAMAPDAIDFKENLELASNLKGGKEL